MALIFCFFNGEVISLVRRRWGQHRLMRSASVVSASYKHRDSMFYNQTQTTIIDPPGRENSTLNGCLSVGKKRNSSISSNSKTRWNPFSRSKKSESSNGLVQNTRVENYDEEKTEVNHECGDNEQRDQGKDGNGNHTRIPRVTFGEDSRI